MHVLVKIVRRCNVTHVICDHLISEKHTNGSGDSCLPGCKEEKHFYQFSKAGRTPKHDNTMVL